MTKYKLKQRRFPRYYSELQKLDRHLVSTLDDVLLPVLPFCPQPHQDKDGSLVPRQWWLNVHAASSNGQNRNYKGVINDSWQQQQHYLSPAASSSSPSLLSTSPDTVKSNNDDTNFDLSRVTAWDTHIQVWLNRITAHPRATLNEGLREFVESEVGVRDINH
jgi:hypothetical protein